MAIKFVWIWIWIWTTNLNAPVCRKAHKWDLLNRHFDNLGLLHACTKIGNICCHTNEVNGHWTWPTKVNGCWTSPKWPSEYHHTWSWDPSFLYFVVLINNLPDVHITENIPVCHLDKCFIMLIDRLTSRHICVRYLWGEPVFFFFFYTTFGFQLKRLLPWTSSVGKTHTTPKRLNLCQCRQFMCANSMLTVVVNLWPSPQEWYW